MRGFNIFNYLNKGLPLVEILIPEIFDTVFNILDQMLEFTAVHTGDLGEPSSDVRYGIMSVYSDRELK